jgi:hypothetical protein
VSNAPSKKNRKEYFIVTHPFHPLYKREFVLVDHRRNWGAEQVFYYDDVGKLAHIPASWTSVSAMDPFIMFAKGKSFFHIDGLLELTKLVRKINGGGK